MVFWAGLSQIQEERLLFNISVKLIVKFDTARKREVDNVVSNECEDFPNQPYKF